MYTDEPPPWDADAGRPGDEREDPQQAIDALLAALPAYPDETRVTMVFDAIPMLIRLDMTAWGKIQAQLKAQAPALNLNDLTRAYNEQRKRAAQQQPPSSGGTQGQLAATLQQQYTGRLAYDLIRQGWMAYTDGVWTPIETERVQQQIAGFLDQALHGNYTWAALVGIERLLHARLRAYRNNPRGYHFGG